MNAEAEIYSDEDRTIFRYHNGRQHVWGDPLAIYERLTGQLGDINKVLAESHAPNPAVAMPARDKLEAAARAAFGMVPFDPDTGAGALREHCVKALSDFKELLEQKKTVAGDWQMSSPATEPESADESAMVSMSASG